MRVLFVHQNFPGQYLHLAPALAGRGHEVVAISKREGVKLPGVRIINYAMQQQRSPGTHPLLGRIENAEAFGESAVRVAIDLKKEAFNPDVICAHPGWGESLFLKDLWPQARQIHYCEFHIHPYGPAQIFDPRAPISLDQLFRSRVNSVVSLFALDAMDAGVTPTQWQHRQFPATYRDLITVQHDGINVAQCRPNPDARFTLPDGRVLTRQHKVITYVARNLEPTRGFPQFMRAIERLLAVDDQVEVLVIGGDEISYGGQHPSGRPWREIMLEEVTIDPGRLHFLGKVPYLNYLQALQISSAHIYLSTPFVLSWSVLEAMAAGCLVIASATEPVREVIEDGVNGLLFDFFDRESLVERITEVLRDSAAFLGIRKQARATVVERYALTRCLPAQVDLVEAFAPRAVA